MENLRVWHGAIFLRKGPHQGAVYKFVINIPKRYNAFNVWPEVRFLSKVFNPYISPETGILDIRAMFPVWDPTAHYMISLLTQIKKIFYLKDSDLCEYKHPANPQALQLLQTASDQYAMEAARCANISQEVVYENPGESPLRFTEPKPAHDNVRRMLSESGELTVRSANDVLNACKRAIDDH